MLYMPNNTVFRKTIFDTDGRENETVDQPGKQWKNLERRAIKIQLGLRLCY
jgi:hypothetical protein